MTTATAATCISTNGLVYALNCRNPPVVVTNGIDVAAELGNNWALNSDGTVVELSVFGADLTPDKPAPPSADMVSIASPGGFSLHYPIW